MASDERFIQASIQGNIHRCWVLVDRQTGVNYLLAGFMASTGVLSTGLTVLVDADGRPVVTPVD